MRYEQRRLPGGIIAGGAPAYGAWFLYEEQDFFSETNIGHQRGLSKLRIVLLPQSTSMEHIQAQSSREWLGKVRGLGLGRLDKKAPEGAL